MCSAGNYLSPLWVIFVGKLIVDEEAKKFCDILEPKDFSIGLYLSHSNPIYIVFY